jgi:hypothetical protein
LRLSRPTASDRPNSGSIDTQPGDDIIASVPEDQAARGASRYELVIATFVGVCALCVSGYTAYVQRQQVRAAVWPILQFDSSNHPDIRFELDNKGVGPAIIKHVIVRLDGQPVKNWSQVLEKLQGPDRPPAIQADMSNRVLSAGEKIIPLQPHGPDQNPIKFDKNNPVYDQLNKDRFRITAEICYSSTLGDCWTLRAGGSRPNSTIECRTCPSPSDVTFQQ